MIKLSHPVVKKALILTWLLLVFPAIYAACQSANASSIWTIQALAIDISQPNPFGSVLSRSEIFVLDSGASKPRKLAEGQSPVFSPDGGKIAFCIREGAGFGQIQVINADGSERKQLGNNKGEACPSDWSPDSQKIALAVQTKNGPMIATIGYPGGNLHLIAPGAGPARFSPDGARLVFYRDADKHAKVKQSIWICNVDGSNLRKVVDDNSEVMEAGWFPDGNSIVFASKRDHDRHSAIYRVNVDGSGLEKIADNEQSGFFFPIFSPDGEHLLVDAAGEKSGLHVVLLDLRTSQGKTLTYGGHPSVVWGKQ